MADALSRLQERFFRLVLAPRGVGPEVPALEADDPEGVPLLRWIRAPDEAGAVRRLDVYANMYFFRLLDVLRGDYPKLAAVLGDAATHNLCTDYVLCHPSDNPSLRHFGRHLPGFLRKHSLLDLRPDLADLAALEWARVQALDVVDEAVLERAAVAALPADAWASHVFPSVRSARLLRLAHSVDQVWAAIERGNAAPPASPRPTHLLVWRRDLVVYHRAVEPGEAPALERILSAQPFAAVCQALVAEGVSTEAATHTALGLLLRWIDEGLLSAPASAFNTEDYEKLAADIRENAFSPLVAGEELFLLALKYKVSQVPPVQLSVEEMTGGLDGAVSCEPQREEEMLERLEIILPHVAAIRDPAEKLRGSAYEWLFGHLVGYGARLHERLAPRTRSALANILESWAKVHPGLKDLASEEAWRETLPPAVRNGLPTKIVDPGWRERAASPGLVGEREVREVLRLLRETENRPVEDS